MGKEVSNRKERSDKKRDLKPTVPIQLYNCISDLAYIGSIPIKDTVEYLCIEGIKSTNVIEVISKYFRRGYLHKSTIYYGDDSIEVKRYIVRKMATKRISTRLTKHDYENIHSLSNALDYTPSSTGSILLEYSIRDSTIIDKFLKEYSYNLDEQRKKVLKNLLKILRKDNPFRQDISFMEIIKIFVDEVKELVSN